MVQASLPTNWSRNAAYPAAVRFKIRFSAQAFLTGMQMLAPAIGLGYISSAGFEFGDVKFGLEFWPNFFDFGNFNHKPPVIRYVVEVYSNLK